MKELLLEQGWLKDALASLDRRAEDVRVRAIVVSELELGDIERQILFVRNPACLVDEARILRLLKPRFEITFRRTAPQPIVVALIKVSPKASDTRSILCA